jgi:hypothetical protein
MKTVLNAKPGYLSWLGQDKLEILKKIEDWPMGFVAEKLVLSGHSNKENVGSHVLWYKQFMSFKGLRPGVRAGMFSDIIDGVWHQHILFTEDYARFGNDIFGFFIHHVPCNVMDLSDEALTEYGTWLTDYEEVYGHLPEDLAKELGDGLKIESTACTSHDHGSGKYKCGVPRE